MRFGVREVFDYGEDEEGQDVSPVVHQTCSQWGYESVLSLLPSKIMPCQANERQDKTKRSGSLLFEIGFTITFV